MLTDLTTHGRQGPGGGISAFPIFCCKGSNVHEGRDYSKNQGAYLYLCLLLRGQTCNSRIEIEPVPKWVLLFKWPAPEDLKSLAGLNPCINSILVPVAEN